jgi:hypothetical protein
MRDRGRVAVALACAAALWGSGCATRGPTLVGARYLVPGHASSIEAPGGEGAVWRLEQVPGAALTFRGEVATTAAQASMSLLERCAGAAPKPRVAARQLLIGLADRDVHEDRAVEVAGFRGWLQALDASDAAGRVHLRTVTVIDANCSLDWVLVAPPESRALDAPFDAWWSSWRPDRGPAPDPDLGDPDPETPDEVPQGDAW